MQCFVFLSRRTDHLWHSDVRAMTLPYLAVLSPDALYIFDINYDLLSLLAKHSSRHKTIIDRFYKKHMSIHITSADFLNQQMAHRKFTVGL